MDREKGDLPVTFRNEMYLLQSMQFLNVVRILDVITGEARKIVTEGVILFGIWHSP